MNFHQFSFGIFSSVSKAIFFYLTVFLVAQNGKKKLLLSIDSNVSYFTYAVYKCVIVFVHFMFIFPFFFLFSLFKCLSAKRAVKSFINLYLTNHLTFVTAIYFLFLSLNSFSVFIILNPILGKK